MNEINNIPEDFESLGKYAPSLSKIAKERVFEVPKDYFEELPSMITGNILVSQLKQVETFETPPGYFEQLPSLIQSRARLEALKKENTFAVPADYFDELPALIQDRLQAKSARVSLLEKLQWFIRPRFAVPAAAIIIGIFAGIYYFSANVENTNTLSAYHPAKAAAEYSIDADALSSSGYVDQIDEATIIEEINTGTDTIPQNKAIEDYLIDNDTDLSQLANSL